MNIMQKIDIEKITLNICVGQPGDNLDKSIKLLNKITNCKPIQTKAKKRIPTWSIRPGLAIGCKVTLRGQKAKDLLKRLLISKDNKLSEKNFDNQGNLSFGILEYIDVPGVEYDASIGIIGFEVAITLKRPGFRIKDRKIKPKSISKKHKISKQEGMDYMKNEFKINIGG
ncbi:MAG: 50S ribosomal protein L5 [Candidatus Woesearchaeota archaeon]